MKQPYQSFKDVVIKKAQSLKLNPAFFLIAIGAAANEKKYRNDKDILIYFGKHLLKEMNEAAQRQLIHKDKNMREAGEYALEKVTDSEMVYESVGLSENIPSISDILNEDSKKSTEIKNLHIALIGELQKQYLKFIQFHGRGIVSGVKIHYPELIEQLKTFSKFMNPDLNEN